MDCNKKTLRCQHHPIVEAPEYLPFFWSIFVLWLSTISAINIALMLNNSTLKKFSPTPISRLKTLGILIKKPTINFGEGVMSFQRLLKQLLLAPWPSVQTIQVSWFLSLCNLQNLVGILDVHWSARVTGDLMIWSPTELCSTHYSVCISFPWYLPPLLLPTYKLVKRELSFSSISVVMLFVSLAFDLPLPLILYTTFCPPKLHEIINGITGS